MDKIIVENQPIFNKLLKKIIETKKMSHAYILVENDLNELKKLAILFSKVLICPNEFCVTCDKCNICKRINNNQYGEIKIINPINEIIKKEEILNLINLFQTESIEGKKLVYIVNEVEKLHPAASNSLLKFLEEPDSNVIAIFTTNNINMVYETIVSRCQVIKLKNNNDVSKQEILNYFEKNDLENIMDFIINIENSSNDNIIKFKEQIIKKYKEREKIKKIFELIFLYYKDILNYIVFKETKFYSIEIVEKSNLIKSSTELITKKILFVFDNLKKLDYNVNITLFMINFLIGIGEIKDGKSSRN